MARRNSLKRVDQKSGRTKQGKFSSKYALTGRLVCGECGAPYKRVTWARNGNKRILWRCVSRLENGTEFCKQSPSVDEPALHDAIMRTVMTVMDERQQVEVFMKEATAVILSGGETESEVTAMETRREELLTLLSDLTDKMLEGDDARITEQLQAAAKEKNEIDARLRGHRQRAAVMDRDSDRMQEMFGIIDDHLKCNGGYDDQLVTAVIERITVNTDGTLTVRMTNGFEANASI